MTHGRFTHIKEEEYNAIRAKHFKNAPPSNNLTEKFNKVAANIYDEMEQLNKQREKEAARKFNKAGRFI